MFSMQPGQITSYPVLGADAWFVLKLEDRRIQPTPSFSSVKQTLRRSLMREGVAGVVTAAMAEVTVRQYDVNGKEASPSDATASSK